MSTKISSYQIDWTLKTIEKKVVEEAYEKAKKYEGKIFRDSKATSISYYLGRDAFECFKARVTKEFESEISPKGIDLIAEGRAGYFYSTLMQDLRVTLLNGRGSREGASLQ